MFEQRNTSHLLQTQPDHTHQIADFVRKQIWSKYGPTLSYDMRGSYEAGVRIHPQKQMNLLGIKYAGCEPISVVDAYKFYGCQWTRKLPPYISEIKNR